MYCRKCGNKINQNSKFCDNCGEAIVIIKQRSDAQKYEDRIKEEKENKKISKTTKKVTQEIHQDLKNPYVVSALMTGALAFLLAMFPWPRSWQIGTSLWMRIIIVAIVLLADYHCTKARQVNNLYKNKYNYEVLPHVLSVATFFSVFTTIIAMFALFTM